MSRLEDGTMTAETMQPGDFEARVTEIVNRILRHHKPRPQRTDSDRESNLSERFVRVEEELKHQRELILEGFAQSNKRFEQIDKRFDESRQDMLARFEQVDKRFEQMREDMNKRFEQVDKRFEQVDKRFEQMREDMNKRFDESRQDMLARFEQVDKRFEDMRYSLDRQVSTLRWSFGIITTLILAAMTAYRFIV